MLCWAGTVPARSERKVNHLREAKTTCCVGQLHCRSAINSGPGFGYHTGNGAVGKFYVFMHEKTAPMAYSSWSICKIPGRDGDVRNTSSFPDTLATTEIIVTQKYHGGIVKSVPPKAVLHAHAAGSD